MAPNDEDLGDESAKSSRDEMYRQIGMYIYWFSQLEYALRIVAAQHLGLTDGQTGWLMPMIDFASICGLCRAQLQTQPAEGREKGLDLINQTFKANEDRIRIAHGLWSESGSFHMSRSSFKYGIHFSDLGELQRKAEEVRRLFHQIFGFFIKPSGV
jgi:hypothetical protein